MRSTPRSRGCSATTTQPSWRDRASRTSSIPTKWPQGQETIQRIIETGELPRGEALHPQGRDCRARAVRGDAGARRGRATVGAARAGAGASPSAGWRRPRCFASTPSSRGASCGGRPSSRLPIRSSKGSRIRSLTTSARRSGRSADSARRWRGSHGERLGDQGRETLDRIRRASARMGELIDARLLIGQPKLVVASTAVGRGPRLQARCRAKSRPAPPGGGEVPRSGNRT